MKARREGKMIIDKKSTDPGLSAAERRIPKQSFTKSW
jgi:hypothetical protein